MSDPKRSGKKRRTKAWHRAVDELAALLFPSDRATDAPRLRVETPRVVQRAAAGRVEPRRTVLNRGPGRYTVHTRKVHVPGILVVFFGKQTGAAIHFHDFHER